MKKIIFSVVTILALVIMSCNRGELEQIEKPIYTIKASIDVFGTKTTMDGNYVNWESGDEISLFTTAGDNILFTLSSGEGTTVGEFVTTTDITGKSFIAALYPYNSGATYSDNKISTTLDASYQWSEGANSKAPMAVLVSNPSNISFKNAGALIAITVNNIPAGYNSISLLSGISINGDAEISFVGGVPSCSILSTEDANKTTTINFSPSDVASDRVFYFPIGVTANPSDISISLSDGANTKSLVSNLGMDKVLRNKRYYKNINLDSNGELPIQLESGEVINSKIIEGGTNFTLPSDVNSIEITSDISDELQITVTSDDESFNISGEGAKGSVVLYTPEETKQLSLDLPNASVEIKPAAGTATFTSITAKTADNTLIVPKGVTIESLIINGGSIRVYGTIKNISNNTDGVITIFKEEGCIIPDNLDSEKFEIVTPILSESELRTAIEVGGKISLGRDIVLTNTLTVPEEKVVTIYLNGYSLSQEKSCSAHYEMIKNNGTLTIKGEGKISFKDTGSGDSTYGWGTYTISNTGTLTVDGGTLENKTALNSATVVKHMYDVIDQRDANAITTINGGTISNLTYRSVRIIRGKLYVNGGKFEGQIWMQPSDDNSSISICGGSFSPMGPDSSSIFIGNGEKSVSFSVTGGTFNTKIGCTSPSKDGVAGKISYGLFSESAKNNTNATLFVTGGSWSDITDGFYTYSVTSAN